MKSKFMVTTLLLVAMFAFSQAQDAGDNEGKWTTGGTASLSFSQVSLTNWSAGGQNTISTTGLVSLFAKYAKGNMSWENYLDLGYGSINQESNDDWLKTDDKIDFTSKYGQKGFENWYYTGLFNFKSQMAAGYNYPNDSLVISDFMSPAYLTLALGMDYKKNDNFTVFIAPLTGRVTIVNDQDMADAGAYGVDPGETSRSEFGANMNINYKGDIMENVGFQTKVDLFSNYLENPQNVDVSWETLISMKVNEYISGTISTHLIYDDDIDIAYDSNDDGTLDAFGPQIQFKEVLGFGLMVKF